MYSWHGLIANLTVFQPHYPSSQSSHSRRNELSIVSLLQIIIVFAAIAVWALASKCEAETTTEAMTTETMATEALTTEALTTEEVVTEVLTTEALTTEKVVTEIAHSLCNPT